MLHVGRMGKVIVKLKLTNQADLVVDPKAQALCPNPAHGDKQMSEEY